MDVERVAAESPPGGPPSWEVARAAVQGYADACLTRGLPVTFFVVPDAAAPLRAVLGATARAGHEIGVHLHLQALGTNYLHPGEFGPLAAYDRAAQAAFLRAARARVHEILGVVPASFRPGFFSASHDTHAACVETGFTAGSTSFPGRDSGRLHARWRHARRDVHVAWRSPEGRTFVEVPVTGHLTRRGTLSRHGDVRLEHLRGRHGLKRARRAIRQALTWQARRHTPLRGHGGGNPSRLARSGGP